MTPSPTRHILWKSLFSTTMLLMMLGMLATPAAEEKSPGIDEPTMAKLGWVVSLQCWTFNQLTLFETIDVAGELGIHHLELYPGQRVSMQGPERVGPDLSEAVTTAIKSRLTERGITAVAFGVANIPQQESAARTLFRWVKDLGITTINSEPDPQNRTHFALIDRLCQEYGIKVGLHNHPKPSTYWDPATTLTAIADCRLQIGFCADTGHWQRSGLVAVECLKKAEGRIVSLHFKDLDATHHDVPYGTGQNRAADQLAELKRQNFSGVISLEYEKPSPHLQQELAACVKFLNATATSLVLAPASPTNPKATP